MIFLARVLHLSTYICSCTTKSGYILHLVSVSMIGLECVRLMFTGVTNVS